MGVIDLALSYKFKAERLDRKAQKTKDKRRKRELELARDICLDRSLRIVNQFPKEFPEPYIQWLIGNSAECPPLKEIGDWRQKQERQRKYRSWIIVGIILTILYFLLGRSK